MKQWTCINCGRVIANYELSAGSRIIVTCKRCKAENELEMQTVEVKRVKVGVQP